MRVCRFSTLFAFALISGILTMMLGAGAATANPLLEPWPGPYGGVPPFDRIEPEHFGPALEVSTRAARREIEAIAANLRAPTFENTIVALERAGSQQKRVVLMYYVWTGSRSSPTFRLIQTEWEPQLAAFNDEIVQNSRLWRRIEAVQQSVQARHLASEQKRLLYLTALRFIRAGAALNDAEKKRVAEINARLAALNVAFHQNELADEEEEVLVVDERSQLRGLPPAMVEAATAEAERRRLNGYVFANTRSAMESLLTFAEDRALRERAFRIWTRRGDHPDPGDPRYARDNGRLVVEILALRHERSRLLGFASYAHWRLSSAMAGTPDKALDLLMQVWRPAIEAARADIHQMQRIADEENRGVRIEPWDHRYYAETLRKAKYDFNAEELSPYLQLEQVRKAMFMMAGKLYRLRFEPVKGVPVFEPATGVYEVKGRHGEHVGLWYFDPYARAGKTSGAWMFPIRLQRKLDITVTPLVSNNTNFIAGRDGEPTLISWNDAVTMFHEFGHALHGLLSDVTYPSLASPHSLLDFGEMPAQMHEKFIQTPEVLALLVDRQGQQIPPPLLERLKKAKTFNQGFITSEYLASAIVDLKLHMSPLPITDPAAFEAQLSEIGMPREIAMRHRIPHFGHVFSSEPGYAAGYYGYEWASVLDRDAFEAFTEKGDAYDPGTARRLVKTILSRGNAVDPAVAFRNFRGRDARIDALLRDRGLSDMGKERAH